MTYAHYQVEPMPARNRYGQEIVYVDATGNILNTAEGQNVEVGDNIYDIGLELDYCDRCESVALRRNYRVNPETGNMLNFTTVTGRAYERGSHNPNVLDWSFDDDCIFLPTSDALRRMLWCHSLESWYGEYSEQSYDYACYSCRDILYDEEAEARERYEDNNSEIVHSYSTKYGDDFSIKFIDVGSFSWDAELLPDELWTETERHRVRVAKPYVGIELEMIPNRSSCSKREAAELLAGYDPDYPNDVFMLKEDGSVSSGFELVTQPHTLKAIRDAKFWQGVDTLRQRGWRSWDIEGVGLHIHINSASFINVAHAMRFVMFIYGNAKPLTRFAGRTSSYAKFDMASFSSEIVRYDTDENGDLTPRIERSLPAVLRKQVQHGDRYLAVNAGSLYSKTLELRFFRGCMLPWVNHAHIEFTFALHEYTKGLTSHDCVAKRALSWASFLSWLKAKSRDENFDYPNLLRRLSDSRRNHYSEYITNIDADGVIIPS